MTDTDDTAPPSVRRVVCGLLADYHTMSHPLLVATAHHEADASPMLVRTTIDRLEREGVIYRVGESWRLTRA